MNVNDMQKINDSWLQASDKQAKILANTRFSMLDMTEYETDFASYSEIPELEFNNLGAMGNMLARWPQTNTLVEVNEIE